MLTLLFLYIVITFFCLFTGFHFYHSIFQRNNTPLEFKPVIFYLVTGLASLVMILQVVVLFTPINVTIQAALTLLLLLATVASRKKTAVFVKHLATLSKGLDRSAIFLFLITIVLLLILNAGPLLMDDAESYHIQSVKWIKEVGTVPGLVHLHQRYAFNSSWFSTIAFFNVPAGHLNYYATLNGVLSVWLAGYLTTLVHSRNLYLSITGILIFIIALASWPLLRGNATNTNYDYITTIIILVLFIETFIAQVEKRFPYLEWAIWPMYLFTVRITNFPFLLLTLAAFVFVIKRKEYKSAFFYLISGAILIIPFLTRNVFLSGYLLYPSMVPDWFAVDWKADTAKTTELLRFIKYYNRVGTGFQPLEITEAMNTGQWIRAWAKYTYNYDRIILVTGSIGLVCFLFTLNKNGVLRKWAIRFFMGAVVLQLITWIITAPDPRFVYGCLMVGAAILAITLGTILQSPAFSWLRKTGIFLTIAFALGLLVLKMATTKSLPDGLYPSTLPSPPVQTIIFNKTTFFIPEPIPGNWNPRCYDTKLPCLYELDPRLQMRGKTLKNGFRLAGTP